MKREKSGFPPPQRVPWWMTLLLAATLLPALAGPALAPFCAGHDELKVLALLFPLYGIASTLMAWFCYRNRRTAVAWVLWALALLSDVALIALFKLLAY